MPTGLQVQTKELAVESGQEEIEIPVKAGQTAGRLKIKAWVRGQPESYPAECQIDVIGP